MYIKFHDKHFGASFIKIGHKNLEIIGIYIYILREIISL